MRVFRRSRGTARLLAAWLVLWFAVMAVGPRVDAAPGPHAAAGFASAHDDLCIQDEHASPASHPAHGTGLLGHCPLCLHAAAPLSIPIRHEGGARASVACAPPPRAQVRVRATTPPPARGPPAFS